MQNLIQTAAAAGNFKTLAAALSAAHLVDTLNGAGPFTVFAPTDEAFAKIPKAELDKLLADEPRLKKLLLFHVVPGKVQAADVTKMKDLSTVKTAVGSDFTLHLNGTPVKLNDSTVTKTRRSASPRPERTTF